MKKNPKAGRTRKRPREARTESERVMMPKQGRVTRGPNPEKPQPPAWFKLSNYRRMKFLSLEEWHEQLFARRLIWPDYFNCPGLDEIRLRIRKTGIIQLPEPYRGSCKMDISAVEIMDPGGIAHEWQLHLRINTAFTWQKIVAEVKDIVRGRQRLIQIETDEWARLMLLPYLDIQDWLRETKARPPQSVLSGWLFPNEEDPEDPDRFDSVKALASRIQTSKVIPQLRSSF